jgi:hypothetical protein
MNGRYTVAPLDASRRNPATCCECAAAPPVLALEAKKRGPAVSGGPPNKVPATSYSPTQLPTQYHRR